MTVDTLTPWLANELWTLKEAAYLLCGQKPRSDGDFRSADRDAGGAVGTAYRALKDATLAGSLDFHEGDGKFEHRRVRPSNVVAWAATDRRMLVPDELMGVARAGTQSKLTETEKATVTKRLARGETVASLARQFHVSRRTIDKCKPLQSQSSLARVTRSWQGRGNKGK